MADIERNEERIFTEITESVPAVDLRTKQQRELLDSFKQYYKEVPFEAASVDGLRYKFENPAYSYSDAIFYYCMIRECRPKRIIEVGSGYSSCVSLDTSHLHFDGNIEHTFIEPYPELLLSLIRDSDKEKVKIIETGIQEVDLSIFAELKENDILFIDSTHVAKVDSDVNYIFSSILPSLSNGVYIHFHDIFYPFEYPRPWIYENRAWNELYMLRAFLEYNDVFHIIVFNTYLQHLYREFFEAHMPLCLKNPGGSIWLKKTR